MGFWKDKWCGDELLCTTFPSLFAIVASKDWAVDVWNTVDEECCWAPRFARLLND